jgi:DNA-binding HxlR family transcriptional regulator
MPVIFVLQDTTKRFNVLQKALPDTTPKVLTEALRTLERNGMIERYVYPTIPPQVEYKLTNLGLELLNISEIMAVWAEKYEEEIKRAQKAYDRRIVRYN